jgi:hypothetical protein
MMYIYRAVVPDFWAVKGIWPGGFSFFSVCSFAAISQYIGYCEANEAEFLIKFYDALSGFPSTTRLMLHSSFRPIIAPVISEYH